MERDSKTEKKEDEKIDVLAALIHEAWRNRRGVGAGGQEPRWEETRDAEWVLAHHGQTKVDLENTDFDALPKDWQKENRASAAFALEEVALAIKDSVALDDAFIESAAARLHERWESGTVGDILPGQVVPFEELAEEEKEKDRAIIRKAIGMFR